MSSENITVVGHTHRSNNQFIRAASLIVGNASGKGLDLSQLRLQFNIRHASVQTPKVLEARIYNVSRQTAASVQKEYTRVILSAGYQGNIGKLFDGQIRQIRFGRENPTDTYLEIIAADGDQAYSQGTISQSLAAGWIASDVHRELVAATAEAKQLMAAGTAAGTQEMQAQGLTAGTPPPDSGAGVRPKVMFGPIRDHCRVLAASTGTSWSIVDGALTFAPLSVPKDQPREVKATVLSPSTGLIGIPKQTIDGIEATCLLNSRLKADGYVTIDTGLINQAQVSAAYGAVQANPNQVEAGSNSYIAGISPSGTYRIVYVDHVGDTRGNEWYSTVACYADDGNAKMSDENRTAVP